MAAVNIVADIESVFTASATTINGTPRISAASIAIVFSMAAFEFPSEKYLYPQGNITISSTAIGARVKVGASDLGLDLTLDQLSSLAEFLNNRFSPGNGYFGWTVVASGANWTLRKGGVSTGVSVSKEIWSALGVALWAYLG